MSSKRTKGTALVTGGAGFIGANVAAGLVRAGWRVIVADDFSEGDWRNLQTLDVEVWPLRADDPELLRAVREGLFDAVFHQAAITDTTVLDAQRMLMENAEAFRRLLEAAIAAEARVVYASSAGVYGNKPAPNRIGDEKPENIYGFSKLVMDRIAQRLAARARRPIVGLRYFNVYGPGEEHKFTRQGTKTASMIRQLYEQARRGGPMRLFEWGEQ
ncbi:MAG: NAD-dependent epimerase/dehydratase family protein, partial [Zetaproteobacteria bacterium]